MDIMGGKNFFVKLKSGLIRSDNYKFWKLRWYLEVCSSVYRGLSNMRDTSQHSALSREWRTNEPHLKNCQRAHQCEPEWSKFPLQQINLACNKEKCSTNDKKRNADVRGRAARLLHWHQGRRNLDSNLAVAIKTFHATFTEVANRSPNARNARLEDNNFSFAAKLPLAWEKAHTPALVRAARQRLAAACCWCFTITWVFSTKNIFSV